MKYPKIVVTLSYKQVDSLGLGFIIKNKVSGLELMVDQSQFPFLLQLDGFTDPYEIAPEYWTKNK